MQDLPHKDRYAGQALLLVLLSMAVVLTIILSILSRSITDVSVTTSEEEALRAFSAAEAGVEQSLIVGSSLPSTQIGDASFETIVTSAIANGKEFASPASLLSGESVTFWLSAHDDTGSLVCDATHQCFTGSQINICWGKSGTASGADTTPAIEVSIYYDATPGNDATARIARVTSDPNSGRRGSNNFSAPDAATCTTDGQDFAFQKTINFATLSPTPIPAAVYNSPNGGLRFVKVRMFYNTAESQPVGTLIPATSGSLPSQGLKISSSGVSGEANRKIEVFESYSEAPTVFDDSIFSREG